jgi:P pilus assembly chaperone PapD
MMVEPMVLDVSSIGKNATTSFKVTNPGSSSLPVEITVSEIHIGSDGETINIPADELLLIYPPQADIEPGGAQTFRVQWIGDPEIATSHNYRVSVSQVPVKRPEQSSGIQLVLSFGVLLSVSPPESTSNIVVSNVAPIADQDGKTAVALSVKNPGNKYAFMKKAAIRWQGNSNWSANLNAVEVEKKLGLGIVQPGKERRFLIPIDVPPGVSDITASIDYKPEN